jgi:hypothetical protein
MVGRLSSKKGLRRFAVVIALAMACAAALAAQAVLPSVQVQDQAVTDSRVVIQEVVSAGPGWLVIHADNGGKPGPVLGWAAVRQGDNPNVVVAIDTKRATPVLYAMLHVDAGTVGVYEFPGTDVPASAGGMMVSPAFKASSPM